MMGKNYKKTQMKNHWDYMKKEWTQFKQLISGEIGLGWDVTKNTSILDDDWCEKLRYISYSVLSIFLTSFNAKFLGLQSSLFFYKRMLNIKSSKTKIFHSYGFAMMYCMGEGARTTNQEQASDIEVGLDEVG